MTGTNTGNGPEKGGVLHALLRFPLFYKILVANAAIVALVTLGCGLLARASHESLDFIPVLAVGLLVSVLSNAVILKIALSPLTELERTADRVRSGDMQARVTSSDLADRQMERLALTFNMMLDGAQATRDRLRDVAARALTAQEEERKRIAQELHDGTAQTLAALRMRLRVARAAPDEAARREELERISADLGAATEEIRRIAQGLRPPALDMLGLVPAIESYARSVSEATGLVVNTNMMPVAGLLSPHAELALYRIVQEAISNAARHSGARSVTVELGVDGAAVVAIVADEGRGFAWVPDLSGGGLGLFGMQERGAYVGGAVEIDSEPGRGTRVRVTIPMAETAHYVRNDSYPAD